MFINYSAQRQFSHILLGFLTVSCGLSCSLVLFFKIELSLFISSMEFEFNNKQLIEFQSCLCWIPKSLRNPWKYILRIIEIEICLTYIFAWRKLQQYVYVILVVDTKAISATFEIWLDILHQLVIYFIQRFV